jgi:hypothetical protein
MVLGHRIYLQRPGFGWNRELDPAGNGEMVLGEAIRNICVAGAA